jgi:glycosyltransferase involved in cell wall biosynthesis
MEFSIVVPVYNEAGNIRPLVEEICAAMAGRKGWELIYVNDGSDDGTRGELYQAHADCAQLRVLQHARRSGQSSALLTGVRAAQAHWIITLDGDGQNDPADIPLLIDRLRLENASPTGIMLAGHRTCRRDSLLKRLSSRIANAVRGRLLKDATPDTGCGLKLFPRGLFLALPVFDHMHRFLPALMQRQGAHVLSVPVRHRSRECGVSKYGIHNRLWVGLVDMAGVMWLQHRRLGHGGNPDSLCAQICDGFGVSWLQRRTCIADAKEEVLDV